MINFKKVNDTRGHKEGDKILLELSKIIQNTIRKDDISSRLGGDEFILLILNQDKKEIKNIMKRIVKNFHKSCEKYLWKTTLSIGVFTTQKELELTELIKKTMT